MRRWQPPDPAASRHQRVDPSLTGLALLLVAVALLGGAALLVLQNEPEAALLVALAGMPALCGGATLLGRSIHRVDQDGHLLSDQEARELIARLKASREAKRTGGVGRRPGLAASLSGWWSRADARSGPARRRAGGGQAHGRR